MKKIALAVAALFAVTAAAQAATMHRHHHYGRGYSSHVVHNGPDYIGRDPDPNIRSYMYRDLDSHYR